MNKDLTQKDKRENIHASFGKYSEVTDLSYCIYFHYNYHPLYLAMSFFISLSHIAVSFLLSQPFVMWLPFLKWNSQMISGWKSSKIILISINWSSDICAPGQTASANVSRKCDTGWSSVNRRKHLQQFCQKSQINFITNRTELKRDLGTMCLLFTCLKYLEEKKRSNI